MQTKFAIVVAFGFSFVAASAPSQKSMAQEKAAVTSKVDIEKKIRFNFQQEEWSVVIPWFADQAGFSLQPINEWPEGTFFLKDDSEYTTMEALDQLNNALRIREPAFTLIRNRNLLVLSRLEGSFPDELIETIKPEELDQRGKHETIICVFDMGELNIDEMFAELEPMISSSNENFFAKFPAVNQIRVRETGGTLRVMREMIESAKRNRQKRMATYTLKHLDSESFMLMVRGQLNMETGKDVAKDDSISITREPFGKRLFIRATEAMHRRFSDVAEVVDSPVEMNTEVKVKKQDFKQYAIQVDPKLAYKMLETVLEGRGAKMQQDELNGSIVVLGTDEDHLEVEKALRALTESSGQGFEIISLKNGDAKMILSALQSLLKQTGTDVKPDAPVVIADPEKNQIIARGTQKDVADIKRIAEKLDDTSVALEDRIRTGTRIIDVDESAELRLPDLLDDLLQGQGRPNNIQIIMPKERKSFKPPGLRGNYRDQKIDDFTKETDGESEEGPDEPRRSVDTKTSRFEQNRSGLETALSKTFFLASHFSGINPPATSLLSFSSTSRQDEEKQDDEKPSPKKSSQNYKAPDEILSVPGDPIVAEFVNGKLILRSRDLDALDDLEYAIGKELGTTSDPETPAIFPITHRNVADIKTVLESLFGMASSGGGGDGGGNPLGNIVKNALPMGDLFSGLLGGGGGGGSSSTADFEGDVAFNVDVPLNYLFVTGATSNDLAKINEYIDILDQPNPAHDPLLVGETNSIKLKYRDSEDAKTMVESLVPDLIDSGKPEGGAQPNNEAAQMMRMMQQMAGGGKGGGGAAPEQKAAKCRIAADTERNYLVVTGPRFIFKQIEDVVRTIDTGSDSPPSTFELLPLPDMDVDVFRMMMESRFGSNLQFKEFEEQDQPESTASSSRPSSGSSPNQPSSRGQMPNIEELRNLMQQGVPGGRGGAGGRGPGGGGGRGPGGGGPGGGGGGRGGRGG